MDDDSYDGSHDAAEAAMNDARIEAGWTWAELADHAAISVPTLKRFRKGHRTPETTRKIERVFGWPRGYLDAIAAGEEPPPIGILAAADTPGTAAELGALRAEAQRLLARADEIEAAMRRRGA